MKDACRVDIPFIVQLSDDLAPIARCPAVSAAWMAAGAYPLADSIAALISESSTAQYLSVGRSKYEEIPRPAGSPLANGLACN
jgi:hypothetical protein